ncbi:hypothetical protein MP638_003232 [Amoeboaphelidium occidentale]|nr:hypothetical protein MP638_003232 [Amoeboaphelidium occidentale]
MISVYRILVVLVCSLSTMVLAAASKSQHDPFDILSIYANHEIATDPDSSPQENNGLRGVSRGVKYAFEDSTREYRKLRAQRLAIRQKCPSLLREKVFRELFHNRLNGRALSTTGYDKKLFLEKQVSAMVLSLTNEEIDSCFKSISTYCKTLKLKEKGERFFKWVLDVYADQDLFLMDSTREFFYKCPVEVVDFNGHISLFNDPKYKEITQNVRALNLHLKPDFNPALPELPQVRRIELTTASPITSEITEGLMSSFNMTNIQMIYFRLDPGAHREESVRHCSEIIRSAVNLKGVILFSSARSPLNIAIDAVPSGILVMKISTAVINQDIADSLEEAFARSQDSLNFLHIAWKIMSASRLRLPENLSQLTLFSAGGDYRGIVFGQVAGLNNLKTFISNIPLSNATFYASLPESVTSLVIADKNAESNTNVLDRLIPQLETIDFLYSSFQNADVSLRNIFYGDKMKMVGFTDCMFGDHEFGPSHDSKVETLAFLQPKWNTTTSSVPDKLDGLIRSMPQLKNIIYHQTLQDNDQLPLDELMTLFFQARALKTLDFLVSKNGLIIEPQMNQEPLAAHLWRQRREVTVIGQ